jgi:transcription initiation factor TFIIB|tara:strand:+ start:3329 stop:4276 length:948 start_codon:yes stop_codon:yes gene_type:complete
MDSNTLAAIWSHIDQINKNKTPTLKPVDNRFCMDCINYKTLTREGMVCTGCGKVDSIYIDDTAEWTSGVSDDGRVSDPSRCMVPTTNQDLFSNAWGKGTVIATKHTSSYETKRMAKINFHSSMNHRDRSLFHAYKDIDEACLSLPEGVLKDAKTLYKKFNENKLTRGAVRSGIKANCVLYACRLANIPRTTKEIATMFGIQCKDLSRTTSMFTEIIQDDKTEKNYVTKPFNVMSRLLNAFEVSREERLQCNQMCNKLEECVDLMSKSPNSVATAIIFTVLGDKMSKSELCEKCGVSIPTLNKIVVITKRHLEDKL